MEVHEELAALPPRYATQGFDDFRPRPGTERAIEACRAYADAFSLETTVGLYLAGPYGSGKTHLAVATLRAAIKQALPFARYCSVASLLDAVRAGKDRQLFDMEPLNEAARAELLIIDDLGQENASDFTRGLLFDLVDGRYREKRPTIVTSNLNDRQLEERLGGALVSRLYEMTQPVPVTASDYRKELAKLQRMT